MTIIAKREQCKPQTNFTHNEIFFDDIKMLYFKV